MTMEFSTTDYEFVHGKKPRGFGRWAFFFDNNGEQPWFYHGSFTNAKKTAIAYARTQGHTRVTVGS